MTPGIDMTGNADAPDQSKPLVGIVMGSRSDWETMQHAALRLEHRGQELRDRAGIEIGPRTAGERILLPGMLAEHPQRTCCCGSHLLDLRHDVARSAFLAKAIEVPRTWSECRNEEARHLVVLRFVVDGGHTADRVGPHRRLEIVVLPERA